MDSGAAREELGCSQASLTFPAKLTKLGGMKTTKKKTKKRKQSCTKCGKVGHNRRTHGKKR